MNSFRFSVARRLPGRSSARAQQTEGVRRIGVLAGIAASDAETKARFAAFSQELQRLGWVEKRMEALVCDAETLG